jgi:hypothetical protein
MEMNNSLPYVLVTTQTRAMIGSLPGEVCVNSLEQITDFCVGDLVRMSEMYGEKRLSFFT